MTNKTEFALSALTPPNRTGDRHGRNNSPSVAAVPLRLDNMDDQLAQKAERPLPAYPAIRITTKGGMVAIDVEISGQWIAAALEQRRPMRNHATECPAAIRLHGYDSFGTKSNNDIFILEVLINGRWVGLVVEDLRDGISHTMEPAGIRFLHLAELRPQPAASYELNALPIFNYMIGAGQ